MKKILYLLFILPLFISCSSDDGEKEEEGQNYTSFIVNNDSNYSMFEVIVATKKDDNYTKLNKLDDILRGQSSKEILVDDNISELYVFFSKEYIETIKIDEPFKIKKHMKNNIYILRNTIGTSVLDKNDPANYPQ